MLFKKKKMAWALVIILAMTSGLYAKSSSPINKISDIKKRIKTITDEDVQKLLRQIVEAGYPNRVSGSKGHNNTINFLTNHLKSLGQDLQVEEFRPQTQTAIDFYLDDFERQIKRRFSSNDPEYKKWQAFTKNKISFIRSRQKITGRNLIWEKKGSLNPKKVLIIGAHYDTIAFDKKNQRIISTGEIPGADNNASGVTAALKLIEMAMTLDLKYTLRVVFFDMKEAGHLGSLDYAQKLKKEIADKSLKILGHIDLFMLGFDSKSQDKNKKYRNFKLYSVRNDHPSFKQSKEMVLYLGQMGKKINSVMKFDILFNGFNFSDNIRFADLGLPVAVYTQNWEHDFNHRGHHSADDFPETINFKTLAYAIRSINGSIIALLRDLRL